MSELKIGLANVSELNFDQSFPQFNAKKKNKWEEFFYLDLNLNAKYNIIMLTSQ